MTMACLTGKGHGKNGIVGPGLAATPEGDRGELHLPGQGDPRDPGHRGGGGGSGLSERKQQKEDQRVEREVLKKGLTDHPDRAAQAVIAWKNRDKLCTAILMVLPGTHTSLSSPQFSEALCVLLCLPSLCCRDRVGLKVGNRRVDLYGEQVVNATMEGAGFIRRHDSIKLELNCMATYYGLSSVCEP